MLINGAPGSGKSTVAEALAQDVPMMLALDVDRIKHSLGGWDDDATASGLHARRLALALAREQLSAGYDVVVSQYLARTAFAEQLEHLASMLGAAYVEIVLDVGDAELAVRLAHRSGNPTRPDHVVNAGLVGPEDATRLVESMHAIRDARPRAIWVDARGSLPSTLNRLREALA